ncbi:hypothetical protein [Streptosporangium sp. NPDC000396]|uniref:hypothetical protein n=1 Tax=Streptosporangium sp. NPDC000396 TaxID=3366185 RepID=UPI0036740DEA
MIHTEHDLRELLAERSTDGSGGAAQLESIIAKGRRIRRRRMGALMAAAVAAVAAVVPVVMALSPGGKSPSVAVAAEPTALLPTTPLPAATPESGKDLPASLKGMGKRLKLIQAYRSETMGLGYTVKFKPTSRFTGYRVTCDDPKAWVLMTYRRARYAETKSITTCGRLPGLTSQSSEESTPANWTQKEQSIVIRVLPSDAPIIDISESQRKGCEVFGKKKKHMCDGKYIVTALLDPKVADRLAAKIGTKPGRWAVGVYDQDKS